MDLGSVLALLKLLGETGLTTKTPPTTVGTAWEALTGAGVRDVEYVVGIDPEALSAWQEEQRIKEAVRRL